MTRFDRRPSARDAPATARQVDLPSRGDHRCDGRGGDDGAKLPRLRRHELHASAVHALGAGVEEPTARKRREQHAFRGVGLRGAHSAKVDVGNAGTLLRLLPGWLAGQPRAGGDHGGRVDPASAGRPHRRAADADGRRRLIPRRPAAAGIDAAQPERHRVPNAGRQRPGEVVPAARGAATRRARRA